MLSAVLHELGWLHWISVFLVHLSEPGLRDLRFYILPTGVRGHWAGPAHGQQIFQPWGDHSGERRVEIVSCSFQTVFILSEYRGGFWRYKVCVVGFSKTFIHQAVGACRPTHTASKQTSEVTTSVRMLLFIHKSFLVIGSVTNWSLNVTPVRTEDSSRSPKTLMIGRLTILKCLCVGVAVQSSDCFILPCSWLLKFVKQLFWKFWVQPFVPLLSET